MAIRAGNIGLQISSPLQFRVFLVPWVRRSNAIFCLKGRDYSSSTPIRYVPKTSSKKTRSENSFPVKDSEKNEMYRDSDAVESRVQIPNTERGAKRSIVLDKRFENQFRLTMDNLSFNDADEEEMHIEHELMEEPEGVVEEPKDVLDEIQIHQLNNGHEQELQTDRILRDVENSAIKLLAARAFTAAELRKKLNGKKFLPNAVEAVILDFRSRGLINDGLYAESFSRSRWSSSTWGPRRIKQALFSKGISEADAENAIKQVFKDGECGEDQDSGVGMSKLSMDHLLVQASKQWLRSHDASKETRKTRIIRWLQYRGFKWGVISFVLKKLETQYPSQSSSS